MKTFKINQIQNKRILGRTCVQNDDGALPLFWAASAVEFNVKAAEVWVKLSSNYVSCEPWVAVEVNNSFTMRFLVPKAFQNDFSKSDFLKSASTSGAASKTDTSSNEGSVSDTGTWFCVARGLNPQKENLITIIKDTQPMPSDPEHALFIHEVALDDAGSFEKVPQRPVKIEFIGDSITSGEGLAGGADEQEWIPQWFRASQSYAVKTSHLLNADWSCLSQCGWGLHWSWDANAECAMPLHYENICSVIPGEYQKKLGGHNLYNFNGGADIVVLNLGTNDNSAHAYLKISEQEYKDTLLKAVKDFLAVIRKHNPKAPIIWTYNMLALDLFPPILEKAVKEYKEQTDDKNIYTLKLQSIQEAEKSVFDAGSRGHPGNGTHKAAALTLVDFIKALPVG